jgi:hypothetical protein
MEGCDCPFIPYVDVIIHQMCQRFAYGAIAFDKSPIVSSEAKKSP